MLHDLRQVALRRFNQEMVVVIHQTVDMDSRPVTL